MDVFIIFVWYPHPLYLQTLVGILFFYQMQNLTIHSYKTDELRHCLNAKICAPQYFDGFEIIIYNQCDTLFFSPKVVIDLVVFFTIRGILGKQKYKSIFFSLAKRFIIIF